MLRNPQFPTAAALVCALHLAIACGETTPDNTDDSTSTTGSTSVPTTGTSTSGQDAEPTSTTLTTGTTIDLTTIDLTTSTTSTTETIDTAGTSTTEATTGAMGTSTGELPVPPVCVSVCEKFSACGEPDMACEPDCAEELAATDPTCKQALEDFGACIVTLTCEQLANDYEGCAPPPRRCP